MPSFSPKKIVLFLLFLLFSPHLSAKEKTHFLIAPRCLLENLEGNYQTLAKSTSLSLVATGNIDSFIKAKHVPRSSPCGGFINVTHAWLSSHQKSAAFLQAHEMPPQYHQPAGRHYSIQYQMQVQQLLAQLNPQELWDDLRTFSDTSQFPNRFQNSASGAKAAAWLQDKVRNLARINNRDDVTISTLPSGMLQDSVVVKIGNSDAAGIVIGAHMDTYDGIKPGADDDGSGCMTVMSIARTLLQSGMQFKRPIYLVWYAAEEFGLIGSQTVVSDFLTRQIPVEAVLQLDMTGYPYQKDPKNKKRLWLVTDGVNPDLTDYLKTLITTYVKKSWATTKCGYACSDHVSWTMKGFPTAFPFESKLKFDNPAIHTSNDKIDNLDPIHMENYAKLGLAFAVELAEPV